MSHYAYPTALLLTPGTVIQNPVPISGFVMEYYDSLEVLDRDIPGTTWLVLARGALRENHLYRLRLLDDSLYADRITVAA